MGREVRLVPPNWKHPTNDRGHEQPMHDRHFDDAFASWLADFDRVRAGNLSDFERECYVEPSPLAAWLQDNHAPDPAYYRPWKDDEATWFQVWETVSEGTPVTPPFSTRTDLIDYLVTNGDFWDQKRWAEGNRFMQPNKPGYSREQAEAFVNAGWAPSMMVSPGGAIASGIEIPHLLKDKAP